MQVSQQGSKAKRICRLEESELITGSPMGLLGATARIYRTDGIRGLFQGHSATLLRIFPYAGVKFMAYDWAESVRAGSRVVGVDFSLHARYSYLHRISVRHFDSLWLGHSLVSSAVQIRAEARAGKASAHS